MTQFDCEEAICDNPGTSFFFPGLLVTVDGSHPSTCLTTYLLWEQILSKSLASSHLGIFCTDYPFPLGCALGAWVDLQTNIHLHLLQRLGSVSVTNTSPLGHSRERQLLAPVHLVHPGELEGFQRHIWKHLLPGIIEWHWDRTLFILKERPAGSKLFPTDSHPSWTQLLRCLTCPKSINYCRGETHGSPVWGGALGVRSGYVKLLKNTHLSASAVCWLSRLLGGSMGCRDPILSSCLWCSTGSPAGKRALSERQHGHSWRGRGRK